MREAKREKPTRRGDWMLLRVYHCTLPSGINIWSILLCQTPIQDCYPASGLLTSIGDLKEHMWCSSKSFGLGEDKLSAKRGAQRHKKERNGCLPRIMCFRKHQNSVYLAAKERIFVIIAQAST
jgi:hypothetical protein